MAPQICYEVIRAVGLDASFVKHDISDPENITWTTTDQNVAYIIPDDDTVYVVCLDEGTATVTASYTCADSTVITCPCNVVVERRNNSVNMVNNVNVTIKEIPPLGNPPNFDISRSSQDNPTDPINVPLFALTSIWPGIDDDDVLTKDPTALHALLYTLEVEKDDDNYVWGDQGWDWDWVPNNVTLQSEGSYVGVARDDGGAGVLLGKCRLPYSRSVSLEGGPVSRLGPHGECYVSYHDVNYNKWLAKIVDRSFAPHPGAIEISQEEKNITMAAGGSYIPALTLRDTNGVAMDKGGLVFTSDRPAVVGAAGCVLTAQQAGAAVVTVTHPDNEALTATINVTVLGSLSGSQLRITTAPLEVSIGQTLPLQAGLLAADGSTAIKGEALEWSSANAAVAEVSAGGQLKGKSAGSATVKVRLTNHPEIAASATVTVRENVVRQVTLAEIKEKINRTVSYYKGGAPGTDWSAFALNAVGEDLNTYVTSGRTYLDNLEVKAKVPGYFGLMTDYERTVIGVVSAGGDPANFAGDINGENGMNLLEKIYNYPSLGQGINAAVFALAALDAANADIPADAVHSRDSLISFILNNRVKEGWCYGGSEPDPDMTGMALYALAPYRDRPAVREAGEAAIQWLSENQEEDGTLKSWGTKNSESISQVIMGVTAWGVDPQGPMFTKQNGNLVTGLLGFYFEDSGMFGHLYGSPDPAMATDQGLEALAALQRYMEKGYSDIFYKIVSVSSGSGEITALEISPEGLEIPPGCTVQLKAADQSGRYVENGQVSWSSSDPAIASVDEEGSLTAHGPGKVQVTATLQSDGAVKDIDIPGQGEKAVQITLSAGTMASVAAKGASSLGINTSVAAFNITPDTFGEETKDKDIVLSAARVDPASLKNPAVPPESIVVDLDAVAGGQAITAFNTPLEVGIPYPGIPADPTAVTVYLIKDDGSLEPVGGTYDRASGLVTFLARHFSRYLAKEVKKQFTDLKDYAWAEEAVETLAGKGIISGKGNGLFDPGAGVTRAEFSSLVTRLLGQRVPENSPLPFKDVAGDSWYHDAVAAAYAGGLISGESPDQFNPEGNITREEMAVIIAKALEQKGYPGGRTEDLAVFKDRAEIASWAQKAAALAVREGIISGVGDGRFAPGENATRAEAAVMLYKLYGLVLR